MKDGNIVAIRVMRSRVAVAVFVGLRLDYAEVRELPHDPLAATQSVRRFVAFVMNRFEPELVVCERNHARPGTRCDHLQHIAHTTLARFRTPRTFTDPANLLEYLSAGHRRTRSEVRIIGAAIWPWIAARGSHPSTFDAAALGLHVQLRRLIADP